MLKSKLNLDEEPQIERAHRTGRKHNNASSSLTRPRTVICKLYDWKVKEAIMKSVRRIKPAGFYVNKDVAEETVKKRKE